MNIKNTQEKAWKQSLLVDKKQIQSLDKDIPKLFSFSMTVSPFSQKISKLLSQHEEVSVKVAKQERLTFIKLSEINTQTGSFRQLLKKYDQSNEYLVKVQNNSQKILTKLQNFRQKMGTIYQDLADEQDKLKDELQLLNKKIEMFGREEHYEQQKQNLKNNNNNREVTIWDRQKQKQIKSTSPKKNDKNTQKLQIIEQRMKQKQKEVEMIDKQIMVLGKHFGWPEEDHTDFLSIWHRGPHKNYFQIQQQLQGYFSFYTAEQIQEHMNKYLKFKKLTEEKKDVISKFKILKEQKKVEELKLLNLERDRSKQQKSKNQMRKKQGQEQQQMKYKIVQWKQIKAKERQLQKQKKRMQQQDRKRDEFLRRRQQNQLRKLKVQEWKQKQKQVNQQQHLKRVQSARKPIIDKQVEQRIRLRQQLLIMKKIQTLNQKKRQEEMIRKKEEKMKEDKIIKYSYVNNKLQHKTVAMKEKEREKFDGKDKKDANTFGGQLLMTGVRATPNWMKGL